MIQLLNGIQQTSSALQAEKLRMEVISQNIANAHVTSGPDGKAYQRQQVVFESLLQEQTGGALPGSAPASVQVARIIKDTSAPKQVYNPHHPAANADGMVSMPNVDVYREMVDMMSATRAYEANLAVVKNARTMAMQALSIGKR